MKKFYLKPKLLLESFCLMDSISLNCTPGAIANYNDPNNCYIEANANFPENVFVGHEACVISEIEFYEAEGFSVFGS